MHLKIALNLIRKLTNLLAGYVLASGLKTEQVYNKGDTRDKVRGKWSQVLIPRYVIL